jgi:hypothetical protein
LLIGENLQKILPEEWFSRVNKLARGRLTKRTELLQVETMGSDGKKPEAQYDIEDMDQSQTT